MTVSLDLAKIATAFMTATGLVRYASGAPCYAGLRFAVDGTPIGDPTWGQALLGASSTVNVVHSPWAISWTQLLGAGSHTFEVQAQTNS